MLYTSASLYYPAIFEPIDIKQIHPKTVNIQVYNSYKDQSMIYEEAWYKPEIRVNGYLQIKPAAIIDSYEDQYYNTEVVRGTPYREYELILEDIPVWIADKVNRATICDGLLIDGVALSRPDNSQMEPSPKANNPLSSYTIKFRERECATSMSIYVAAVNVGDMPQTDNFFIEVLVVGGQSKLVRRGFTGKRNFLDFLNATYTHKAGYNGFWSESVNGRLFFTPDVDYTLSGTWELTAANVLSYGLTFNFYNGYTFAVTITPPAGTQYYATSYGVNRTVYAGAVALSVSSSQKFDSKCTVYFSDAVSIVNTTTSGICKSIQGNLPPSITTFNLQNTAIERIVNNIFTYTTVLAVINLTVNKIPSSEINNILNFIYDVRRKLSPSCVASLNGQVPSAPPIRSDGMNLIISLIRTFITTLTTD